jgi:hypothetical protein
MAEKDFRSPEVIKEIQDITEWLSEKYSSEVAITFVNTEGCHTVGRLSPDSMMQWGASVINSIRRVDPALLMGVMVGVKALNDGNEDTEFQCQRIPKQ